MAYTHMYSQAYRAQASMQIYMHGHGEGKPPPEYDTNAQVGHTQVHLCMDRQGHRAPVISSFKQIQASVLQRHSEAGRGIDSGRWGTASVRLRPGVST